jgi:hypothetical protein
LDRLIKGLHCRASIGGGLGPFGVVVACGQFELTGERDVAVALCWRPPDPGLDADRDVAESAGTINIQRAALAVARGYECRYAGDCAQAWSYLIVQIQFKKVDVVDDGVVLDRALLLIDGSNIVLVGVVDAKACRDCQTVQ